MGKKIVVGGLVVLLVLTVGLFLWARGVLAGDAVRSAVETQLTRALGQPVTIGAAGATIFPRVTLTLSDVAIGTPARIRADQLAVGASLGALLSRRIEHATLRLSGTHIDLPLPMFAIAASSGDTGDEEAAGAPVTLVSVDEVRIDDATVTSGGRTLTANLEMVPAGDGLEIRSLTLAADDERIEITWRISDLTGPKGSLTVSADTISFDRLLLFVSDVADNAVAGAPQRGAPSTTGQPGPWPTAAAMHLEIGVKARRATFGGLALSDLSGRGRITTEAVNFDTIAFGVFDGQYDGSLDLTLGKTPGFRIRAAVSDVDMAQVMTFAGHPGLVTGRLAGRLDVAGAGLDADAVLRTANGTARVDLADGTVTGLGLVRGVVLATSMRGDSKAAVGGTSVDEPFTTLAATLTIDGALARTGDLRFESENLLLTAAGTIRLDGGPVDLDGRVQLSEALSAQAGRDLLRYTAENGRVTLPVSVTGTATDPQVNVDLADLTKRAIGNRVEDEAKEAVKKGLGGLLGR